MQEVASNGSSPVDSVKRMPGVAKSQSSATGIRITNDGNWKSERFESRRQGDMVNLAGCCSAIPGVTLSVRRLRAPLSLGPAPASYASSLFL
jgi:hypothetical protein